MLAGAVAWVHCTVEAEHDAGDHVIVVGRVRELDVANPRATSVEQRLADIEKRLGQLLEEVKRLRKEVKEKRAR